jgi:hypothetical protein
MQKTYYFSTQGCSLVVSFGAGAFEDVPFVAAASLRALRSKKFAIIKGFPKAFQRGIGVDIRF